MFFRGQKYKRNNVLKPDGFCMFEKLVVVKTARFRGKLFFD